MKIKLLAAAVLAAALFPLSVQAQLMREDGVKSIAGILVPGSQDTAEYTFSSKGGEILFATLDAEIYRVRSGEREISPLAEESCSEDTGPGLFYIEVAEKAGAVVCHADKPLPPPGWMRDPRMACLLPQSAQEVVYVLKVGLLPSTEITQPYYSFLLNVSLRGIARSGINLHTAIGASGNNF